MRMVPHAAPCQCICVHCACGWAMWSTCQKLVRLNWTPKSEYNLYLACEDSPQRTFFFCTFSFFSCPLSFYYTLTMLLFSFSALDSKHVHCGGPTTLSSPYFIVKKRHFSLSSSLGILACQCTWHSWTWPTCTGVHTYRRMNACAVPCNSNKVTNYGNKICNRHSENFYIATLHCYWHTQLMLSQSGHVYSFLISPSIQASVGCCVHH